MCGVEHTTFPTRHHCAGDDQGNSLVLARIGRVPPPRLLRAWPPQDAGANEQSGDRHQDRRADRCTLRQEVAFRLVRSPAGASLLNLGDVELRPRSFRNVEVKPPSIRTEARMRVRDSPRFRTVAVVETMQDAVSPAVEISHHDTPFALFPTKWFECRIRGEQFTIGRDRGMRPGKYGKTGNRAWFSGAGVF
jgi:hypothetical protein